MKQYLDLLRDVLESGVQKGDTQLGYENYENVKTFFNDDKMSKRIGSISKEFQI